MDKYDIMPRRKYLVGGKIENTKEFINKIRQLTGQQTRFILINQREYFEIVIEYQDIRVPEGDYFVFEHNKFIFLKEYEFENEYEQFID